jgi:putative endonuclease
MFFVYVIKSLKDGSTYIGSSENVENRLKQHNAGKTKSIKSKTPFYIVHVENYELKSDAIKRERRLKNNSWEKEQLFKKIFVK